MATFQTTLLDKSVKMAVSPSLHFHHSGNEAHGFDVDMNHLDARLRAVERRKPRCFKAVLIGRQVAIFNQRQFRSNHQPNKRSLLISMIAQGQYQAKSPIRRSMRCIHIFQSFSPLLPLPHAPSFHTLLFLSFSSTKPPSPLPLPSAPLPPKSRWLLHLRLLVGLGWDDTYVPTYSKLLCYDRTR